MFHDHAPHYHSISVENDVVDADRYGADNTGIRDAYPVIQELIDRSAPAIRLKGTYLLRTGLVMKPDQVLYGMPKTIAYQNFNKCVKLNFAPGVPNQVCIKNAPGGVGVSAGCGIKDIGIQMNDNTHTAIQISGAYGASVENIQFSGTFNIGLLSDDAYACNYSNLAFNGPVIGLACVYLGTHHTMNLNRIQTTSVVAANPANCLYGIAIAGPGLCTSIYMPILQGCTIGIANASSRSLVITSPYFENTLCNMRLGNYPAASGIGTTKVIGGYFSVASTAHPQYDKRGPIVLTDCNTLQLDMPDFFMTPDNTTARGPWPLVIGDVQNFVTMIQPIQLGRTLTFRRQATTSCGLTIIGGKYASSDKQCTENIIGDNNAYNTQTHGSQVNNVGTLSQVAYQPAILFAPVDTLLTTPLATGASLVL